MPLLTKRFQGWAQILAPWRGPCWERVSYLSNSSASNQKGSLVDMPSASFLQVYASQSQGWWVPSRKQREIKRVASSLPFWFTFAHIWYWVPQWHFAITNPDISYLRCCKIIMLHTMFSSPLPSGVLPAGNVHRKHHCTSPFLFYTPQWSQKTSLFHSTKHFAEYCDNSHYVLFTGNPYTWKSVREMGIKHLKVFHCPVSAR